MVSIEAARAEPFSVKLAAIEAVIAAVAMAVAATLAVSAAAAMAVAVAVVTELRRIICCYAEAAMLHGRPGLQLLFRAVAAKGQLLLWAAPVQQPGTRGNTPAPSAVRLAPQKLVVD